jgi:hypothetical protein
MFIIAALAIFGPIFIAVSDNPDIFVPIFIGVVDVFDRRSEAYNDPFT